ncbi:hypothetical protein Ddye_005445 [Dipteronia dyeriana]|uniref:RNase H type-1 domain-containing protein n=1 Tax=Dipteronia dyeriana TaxID=168575 RepID=A0AAD9XGI8_9ROSI|nr:hypothetical protein Ddye_005445 [Dipteronia dyeriana]
MARQVVASGGGHMRRFKRCFSDSKSAVSWIKGEDFGNFELVRMVYDIIHFLQERRGLDIDFMPRSSNSLADSLVKSSASMCGDKLEWGDFCIQ